MLAVAHPLQHQPVDCPHRAPSSTSGPSRSTRPLSRKPQPPFSSHSHALSSSSSSHHPPSSASRSVSLEGPSSPRRTVPQRTPSHRSSRSSVFDYEDDDPSTPPGSESEDNEHEPSVREQLAAVDIHNYDPSTLLHLLANALSEIASMNTDRNHTEPYMSSSMQPRPSSTESHPPIWRTLTSASRHALSTASSLSFHARNVPTIALEAYLTRIQKYCPASNEVFVSLLVYFDRMMKLAKESCGKVFAIDMYNVHRLVIAGVTVASKFFSDVFYTNSRYAKVGGLPLAELNQLELQFLLLNDFHLMVSQEEMQYYASKLVKQSQIPSGVSLTPFIPVSPSATQTHRSPVGPLKYFAAIDGYLLHLQAHTDSSSHHSNHHTHASAARPNAEYRRSGSSYSASASDATSEAGTETDIDGSTDDEPTIRAPHSSASSETMSLHSATSGDADSIYTDDGQSEEGDDADSIRGSDGAHERDYRVMMSP
ncbi:PHO85 cyclin-7 [Grifola frondosa]|uniref:PHO85 cyclin-7 n=1 Tax=Grifola frondosa TaxID=5627 RepID=A0A1C7M5T7_GRIFR|nr:PHO85 cyclin-7 [Grifola frondosa]